MANERFADSGFIPTTNIYDVDTLKDMKVDSPEFSELLVRLYQNNNRSALVINNKISGTFYDAETLTGGTYLPDPATTGEIGRYGRSIFRQTINFGPLPNAGAKSVIHRIIVPPNMKLVHMYGGTTDPATSSFLPLPFASTTLNQNIQLEANATNVIITTGIDRTAYTETFVVMEYLKQ